MVRFTYPKGVLWDEPSRVIVNPINCVGVMGAGVAKVFRDSFPFMFEMYRIACSRRALWPGDLFIYVSPVYTVVNVATKGHYRFASKVSYIQDIVTNLNATKQELGPAIGMPKIGTGYGRIQWEQVKWLFEQKSELETINVYTDTMHPKWNDESWGTFVGVHKGNQFDPFTRADYDETEYYVNETTYRLRSQRG